MRLDEIVKAARGLVRRERGSAECQVGCMRTLERRKKREELKRGRISEREGKRKRERRVDERTKREAAFPIVIHGEVGNTARRSGGNGSAASPASAVQRES